MQVPFPHNLPIPVISQPFLGCKSSCFAKLGSNLCGKAVKVPGISTKICPIIMNV